MSRELDAEVAEKVMGWQRGPDYNYWMSFDAEGSFKLHKLMATWKPSEDISAAMEVVEKLESLGFDIAMWRRYGSTFWEVEFNSGKTNGEADARTLPEAICRAALASITEKESNNH